METQNYRELAKKFESEIKAAIETKLGVSSNELALLLEDKEGIYLSKEQANTLCCFVIGQENGFLYLVTAAIQNNGEVLDDFKVAVVS